MDDTIDGNTGLLQVELQPDGNIEPSTVLLDFSDISQYADDFAIYAITSDGQAPGSYERMDIADSGILEAVYSNGLKVPTAQMALALIPNEQDMLSIGNGWEATLSSGTPIISTPLVSSLGDIRTNMLESSNVDLLNELVHLVVAQRNYQANTKSLKTSEATVQALMSSF